MARPRTARCGTASGYRRHQGDNEKPCDACAAAKREYDKRWREAPRRQQINRANASAQIRAYGELARRHRDEYRALYLAIKAETWAERGLS